MCSLTSQSFYWKIYGMSSFYLSNDMLAQVLTRVRGIMRKNFENYVQRF